MAAIDSIDDEKLRAICDILADTSDGLTGSEIGKLLADSGIDDPAQGVTKRDRLFVALQGCQRRDHCANNVLAFIGRAMDPVRYVRDKSKFADRRTGLNEALVFAGYAVGEDGSIRITSPASTLTEAQGRAGRLRSLLEQQAAVHPDVLRACRPELVTDNYFHAVLEATKSLAEKIRNRTGLTSDGSSLVDEAFGFKNNVPYLAINSLRTDSEQSEQSGFMNLLKGTFGHFRNPTAHVPKIVWNMSERDALDLLTFASYLHRRLDAAVRTHRA